MNKDETKIAYAAGIIDGEGCVSIIKNRDSRVSQKYSYRMTIQVGMTSHLVPEWLQRHFGGRVCYFPRKYQGYSVIVAWWMIGSKEALSFLKQIYPYITEKKDQVDLAIQFQENRVRGGHFTKAPEIFERETVLFDEISRLKRRHRIYES